MSASRVLLSALVAASIAGAAGAQPSPSATVIALPPMTSPDSGTKGNESLAYAWQATQLIETDLRQTAELMPLSPDRKDYYSFPEVTAPSFSKWRERGAKGLITGFVQQRPDGRLTVGCYVYDVDKGRELGRIGFVAAPGDLRRAAHKCSGLAYKAITGSPGMFDTRIAYVAETGAPEARVKRIAIMDSDGFDHSYVTAGETTVLTPRLSPKGGRLAYVSFQGGVPQVRVVDLGSSSQRPLLPGNAMTFAPRFSPDGSKIIFSMMLGTNSDIYVVGANGGMPQRLTTAPGIDTDASFSPDGSKIVFESDRSGTQQLYVMNADGSNERRITFGTAAYSSPEWSPDGNLIAFTWRFGDTRRVGIINPDGTGEKILTGGPTDEGPSWAASSRELVFQRTDPTGRPGIYRVSLDGSQPRKMTIPQDGSDPNWSGAMD
ncbi:MAG TPA: Tol-Pal system beta propeller repeat protein TolB [Sphingomicrobium sp.]|nr:Tol-Pal system beta propeller repeat protein TolB [Sphingomicrobium sp.]